MCKNKKLFKFLQKVTFFIIILAVFLIISAAVFKVSATDYQNHWAKDTFEDWIRLGILVTDYNGNIYPESPVTLGELSSYINKIMGFSDSQYYGEPSSYVTREQAINIFSKVARINPMPGDLIVLSEVRDSALISNAYKESVAAAINNGFIAGRPGNIVQPKDYMTVSEAIVMLDRLNAGRRVYAFPGKFGSDYAGHAISNYTTVMSSGITLQNADVSKDLEITPEVKEGDFYLNSSAVRQNLIINGGENIYLKNDFINQININKKGARLIYAENGNTDTETLVINGDDVTVDINKSNKTKNIIINGINAIINVGENVTVEDLTVNGVNSVINLAKGSKINKSNLNAPSQIKGKGSVGSLAANPGSGGSVIEPVPDEVSAAQGESILIDNKPAGSGKKITSVSFLTPFTLTVETEDVGKISITKSDFRVLINGTPDNNFSVSKVNSTEFNIILTSELSSSAEIKISGVNNLSGSATLSQNSQAMIKEAFVTGLRTISITITNPENKAFSKDNFRLRIAGKDSDVFTVAALSLTSYNLYIATDIKNGQVITISGRYGLSGSAEVSAVAAVKSLVFSDNSQFIINTDNTSGNKIDAGCFNIFIDGGPTENFTVLEKSKTSYQINLSYALAEGTVITVEGKKYLTGKLSEQYSSPFKISKVNVTGKTNINITLSSVPDVVLTADKYAGAFKVLVGDSSVNVTDIKKDPSDKKNIIYDLTVNLDNKQGILSVNGAKESKNKGMVDYVPPELVSVRINDRALNASSPAFRVEQSKAKLIIDFTEPVFKQAPSTRFTNKDVALSGVAFNIISGTGAGVDLNGVKLSAAANSVIIDLSGAKFMEPGIYTLTLDTSGIYDSFGNICKKPQNNIFRFEIKGAFPNLSSAKQTETGNLEIKLSGTYADTFGTAMFYNGIIKIMDGPTQKGRDITSDYISYDSKAKTITVNRDAFAPAASDLNNAFVLNKDTYKLILFHPSFSGRLGEADFEVSRIKIDTVRPEIIKITIKENPLTEINSLTNETETPEITVSKSNAVIQIEFSKPVFSKPPSTKFAAKDLDTYGQPFNIDASDSENIDLRGAKVSSNNRFVSIALNSVQLLNPDTYLLKIDTGLIFDSVGNTVKPLADSTILKYYFNIVRTPPGVTYIRQQTNGDIQIRFSRYSSIVDGYGQDMYAEGVLKIFDITASGEERQIGGDITSEFLEWNATTKTLTVKRMGIPENLNGNYAIEITHIDYERLITPKLNIISGINNDPSVTVGGDKNIPVTTNAEQTRITREDAVISIKFPISVTSSGGANFTINDLSVTEDINSYPFSVYAEDGEGINLRLDKSDIIFRHNGDRIIIDLTNAVKSDMLNMKFTVAVNQSMIYDRKNSLIGSKLGIYRFKLTRPPLPVKSAAQIDATGNIKIIFAVNYDDTAALLEARDYINSVAANTVRIERKGEIIGYINDALSYEGISPDNIIIDKNLLNQLLSPDGNHVELSGAYTVVLTHSGYADNRISCDIDTTPPQIMKDYPKASISGSRVTVTFSFDEPATVTDFSVTNRYGQAQAADITPQDSYARIITMSFNVAAGSVPADYITKITVADKFLNIKEYTGDMFALSVKPHEKNKIAVSNAIPGFTHEIVAADNSDISKGYKILFKEAGNFGSYYNIATRKVTDNSLLSKLAGESLDNNLAAAGVTLKTGMSVTAPDNAIRVRWAKANELSGGYFSGNTANIQPSQSVTFDYDYVIFYAADNKLTWTAERLANDGLIWYYIFEWTMSDGSITYTYIRRDIVSTP